jgi:hypothetical protein
MMIQLIRGASRESPLSVEVRSCWRVSKKSNTSSEIGYRRFGIFSQSLTSAMISLVRPPAGRTEGGNGNFRSLNIIATAAMYPLRVVDQTVRDRILLPWIRDSLYSSIRGLHRRRRCFSLLGRGRRCGFGDRREGTKPLWRL